MKKVYKILITFICALAFATVSMILVNCIPNERMLGHIKESAVVFSTEGDYSETIPGMLSSRRDNFTDSIMLFSSAYKADTGVVDRAMNCYRVTYPEKRPSECIVAYAGGDKNMGTVSYSRYWHGYQLFLKPALLFLNFQEIRVLNTFAHMLVIAAVIAAMLKKNMKAYIIPYLLMVLSICPTSVALSLQFSSVFYIANIATIVMLLGHEYLEKKDAYALFFVVVGMCTSFMDFLTYPLITLGIPLTFLMVLRKKQGFVKNILDVIKSSILWAIGYAGMWAGKWFIGSALLRKNIVTDAVNALLNRSSTEQADTAISRMDAIQKNMDTMFITPVKMILLAIIVVGLVAIIIKSIKEKKIYFCHASMFLISVMPFAWYFVTTNHSYVHFWFTYRELAILVFALAMWGVGNIMNCFEESLGVKQVDYAEE